MQYGDLISVVIPVCNRAHAITRSVGSICRQSYENLDIIVIDDCSTDDIEGAIATLDDPRVRLIRREKNGGAAAARNSGLAAAAGDLVAFMDSDDISLFDRFEQEMSFFAVCQRIISASIPPPSAILKPRKKPADRQEYTCCHPYTAAR